MDILNKFNLDSKKIMLILIVAFIFAYIDFSFLIKAQTNSIARIGPKIAKLKSDIDNTNRQLVILRNQPKVKEGSANKAKKIISENELNILLQEISDVANQNNVRILEIKPARGAPKTTAVKTTTPKGPANQNFVLIPLDLTASFHSLGGFINGLENNQKLIIINELKIANDSNDYFKQKASLLLKIYVKK